MILLVKKYKFEIILGILIFLYATYFSYFTILRHQRLGSAYYDLGIMDQTVYNTFKGRILELTDPVGSGNFKRMAIHNDILLAFLAPFYFIHQGPETLLVIQSVILAFGAVSLYLLAIKILKSKLFGLVIAFSYLIYPPLQRANIFDFHAVTLATSLLLLMFYFAYVKKYFLSLVFFVLAILAKENVALTTAMFGLATLLSRMRSRINGRVFTYGLTVFFISLFWFVLSIWVIIPHFRQGQHFAISRYANLGETPAGVIKGLLTKPQAHFNYIFQIDTLRYFFFLFAPVSFISLFSPTYILIALPEFAINLLNNDWHMKSIIYHYTAVITPFIFIAAIFGTKRILERKKFLNSKNLSLIILLSALLMSYFKGPLPYSKEADLFPYIRVRPEIKDVNIWKRVVKDENLIISASEHLAAQFSQRKVLYRFPGGYQKSDYVLILVDDVYNDWLDKKSSIKAYEKLVNDVVFEKIYQKGKFEVYKRVKSS